MWLETFCIGAVALLCRGNVTAVAATVVLHREVNTATAGKSILVLSLNHTVQVAPWATCLAPEFLEPEKVSLKHSSDLKWRQLLPFIRAQEISGGFSEIRKEFRCQAAKPNNVFQYCPQ